VPFGPEIWERAVRLSQRRVAKLGVRTLDVLLLRLRCCSRRTFSIRLMEDSLRAGKVCACCRP